MAMAQTTTTPTQEGRSLDTAVTPSAASAPLMNTQETTQVSPLLAAKPPRFPPTSTPQHSTAYLGIFPTPKDPVSPTPDNPSPNPSDPQVTLTFLLVTGQRRTLSFPEETTAARVKEILWNTWPTELQGEQPPAPSFLRLVHLGKIWTDDARLVGE